MHLWRRFTQGYATLLSWLLAVSVAILVIPVSLQIFSRYTALIPSYIWTEEMARFLFVWTIMIGAMIGVRESTHFEVDLWPRLSPRAEAAIKLVARLCVLVVAVVFIWAGMKFTGFPAYVMWAFIHVLYLIGWGNRLGTLYTWARALWFTLTGRIGPSRSIRPATR